MRNAVKGIMIAGLAAITFKAEAQKDFTRYVDPLIGSGGHGHVFVGANVPFGYTQVGPTNLTSGWDWVSGYHYGDETLAGFSQLHLSGTGIGDLGDITLLPLNTKYEKPKLITSTQRVTPGHYAVTLDNRVQVELAATTRGAIHKYTFKENKGTVKIDLEKGVGWDGVTASGLKMVDDYTLEGYRYSKGWANNQKVYFYMKFSAPIRALEIKDSTTLQRGREYKGKRVTALAEFNLPTKGLTVKMALSPVSTLNAKLNFTEVANTTLAAAVTAAKQKWNKELSKIEVNAATDSIKKIFYTAFYHTMIAPSVFCDVNGDYFGSDGKIYNTDNKFTNYTTFSLWDTYRAAHPLFTITQPKRSSDFVNTMLHIFEQQGKLPVWHLMGNETNTMVGNPAIPVVADALLKKLPGINSELAYKAMTTSANLDERGLKYMRSPGYLPTDKTQESVASGMEYALADYQISKVAKMMHKPDYNYWLKRGESYKLYFDNETRFMRPKKADGAWKTPFNPFESVHRENDYTEGTAWQYLWLVPQDVNGLIGLLGGKQKFAAKLDSLFVVTGDMGSTASPDISGLIGQYAHGNEPSHHIAYLYGYAGMQYKTAARVREILSTQYNTGKAGLSGNEDVGQMSAWYVLSSMGIYQVDPAGGQYRIGSPALNAAKLKLENGKVFEINAINNNPGNVYIQRATLNGKAYDKPYIMYADIMRGGKLVLYMGSSKTNWGS